jgi:hypothetical protein
MCIHIKKIECGIEDMMGTYLNPIDWVSLIIAIVITLNVAVVAKNPHEKGTDEYTALRVCRVGLVLLAWSFGFGMVGFAFALTAFFLGIIGIVKGRSFYGVMLIVGSLVIPYLGMLNTFSGLVP